MMLAMTLFRELISGHSASCSTSEGFEMLYHVMLMSPRSHTGFTSRLFKTSSRHGWSKRGALQTDCIAIRAGASLCAAWHEHDMSMACAWHVHGMCSLKPRRSIEMLQSSWWVDEAVSAQFRRQSSTATWQLMTDFLLETRFAKYEVTLSIIKETKGKKWKEWERIERMEKNGEQWRRIE